LFNNTQNVIDTQKRGRFRPLFCAAIFQELIALQTR
jgi:hypothetical protein